MFEPPEYLNSQRTPANSGYLERRGGHVLGSHPSVDQIISKLRRADVELGKGKKVPEVCKLIEIKEQTYYRWRQKYGSMQPDMAKQFKALQKENARLKKMVAE